MRVAVVTSVYNHYDPIIRPLDQSIEIDWVCITDGTSAPPPQPWRELIEPRPHMFARMAAKVARCRPDLYTDCDVAVWLDASARLNCETAIEEMVEHLGNGWIAQYVHPERDNIVEEAEVSTGLRKYAGQDVKRQAAYYMAQGLPGNFGLWATGCIVRRNVAASRLFGDQWLREMCRWTWQDQISEPYVLWKIGAVPHTIPGDLWANPLVGFNYDQRKRDD